MRRFMYSAIAMLALAIGTQAAEVSYDVRPADGAASPVQVGPGATVAYEVTILVSDDDNDGLLFFLFDLLTDLGVPQSTDSIEFDPLIVSEFDFLPLQYGIATDDDILEIGGTQGFGLGGETLGIGHGSPQVLIRGELQTPTNQLGDFNVIIGPDTKTQLIAPGGGIVDDPAITTNRGPGFVIQVLADSDGDQTPDIIDGCPNDPAKIDPGLCGCGVPDTDTDGDSTPDCNDGCQDDPGKIDPGVCGCGVPDTDTDGDATPDCLKPPANGVVVPPGCAAGVGAANLVGFGTLCLVGLVGLRRRRWH